MANTKCIIKKRTWESSQNQGLVEAAIETHDLDATFKELQSKAPGESIHSLYVEGIDPEGNRKRFVFELKSVLTLA